MKGLGLHSSFGIDHALKASRRGPVVQLDLLKSSHQSLLLQWLSSELLVSVWFAPPCGTASRAREIPMSPSEHGPPPLRTSDSPDGVSSLSAKELERVQKANCLYSFTTMCCLHLSQLSKPWVVENPSRSLYWDTSFWQDVHELCQPDYFQFHELLSRRALGPRGPSGVSGTQACPGAGRLGVASATTQRTATGLVRGTESGRGVGGSVACSA